MSGITVHLLRDRLQYFDAVVSLGDRHKSKLGLFPEGALRDAANAGCGLIGCEGAQLLGYLLYRVSTRHPRRATLVHLCVEPEHRGRGVARLLVDELKQQTRDLTSIRLSCRRDYDENKLWPRLGFQLLGEKPGRSHTGTPLNIWSFDHSTPLLSAISKKISEQHIVVTLDANIVFDLDSDTVPALESQALLSDWLTEHIHPFVTPELSIEINRGEDAATRERSRTTATKFMVLPGDDQKLLQAKQALVAIFGHPRDDNEASDIRQIAWSVAGGAEYFITRDQRLLDMSEVVRDALDISIVRPSQIITEFDEVINRLAYQPGRFDGSQLFRRAVGARDEERLTETYLDSKGAERRRQLAQSLRYAFSTQPGSVSEIASADVQSYVLAQVITSTTDVTIPILRATTAGLSPTVVRQLLTSVGLQHPGLNIRVTEPRISAIVEEALVEARFLRLNDKWFKPCPRYVGPAEGIAALMQTGYPPLTLELIRTSIQSGAPTELLALERVLSPAKFTELSLPCYIIPIRSHWAAQLFDHDLARQDLFGIRPELGFRLENVYYRAAQGSLEAPARILWYVSMKGSYVGTGSIRATSYLDEVVTGPPKRLFAAFKRLGVYNWPEVYKTASQSLDKHIMALRFSGTELLSQPIPWDVLQDALQAHTGKGNQVQGPIQITQDLYFELYSRATATPQSTND